MSVDVKAPGNPAPRARPRRSDGEAHAAPLSFPLRPSSEVGPRCTCTRANEEDYHANAANRARNQTIASLSHTLCLGRSAEAGVKRQIAFF